jgi:hypothetical protein
MRSVSRKNEAGRTFTLECCVAGLVHFAHPAFAEQGEHFVVTELVAYRQRHITDSIQFTRSRTSLLLRLRKVTQARFEKMTYRSRIDILVIDDWVGAGAPRLLGDL